jgi:hypothetical protein
VHCRIARAALAGVSRVTQRRAFRVFATGAAVLETEVATDEGEIMTQVTRSLTSQETPTPDPTQAPTPTPPVTPTVTHYQEVAVQLIGALDSFTGSIPDFQNSTPATKDFVKRKRSVPARFVTAAVGSLQLSPELQGVKQLNAAASQDDAQYVEALTPVLMQLGVVFKGLQATINTRKARLASGAQKIYAVAKGLAQDSDAAAVAAHVENMKRALRPRHSRKSKSQPAPAPTPAPVPAPHAAGEGTGGGSQK